MKEKLSLSQIVSLSLMLFALFFGAGNMIFPPALGQASGENVWPALAGFIVTDAGISVLGIAAIVFGGQKPGGSVAEGGAAFCSRFCDHGLFLDRAAVRDPADGQCVV